MGKKGSQPVYDVGGPYLSVDVGPGNSFWTISHGVSVSRIVTLGGLGLDGVFDLDVGFWVYGVI